MKSSYNEALASQKVFCKYYIRLVMDAFISFSKYFIQSILDTESSWLLPLSHEKAQILNPNELTTNSFPSEVEIKERERGKERGRSCALSNTQAKIYIPLCTASHKSITG